MTGSSEASRAGTEAYGVLLDAVAAAHADGQVTGPVESVTLAAWSLVHGLATLLIDGPLADAAGTDAPADELAATVTALLVRGIGALGAPAP